MTSEYIYTIDKLNGCILAACMQGERGGSALERTPKSTLWTVGAYIDLRPTYLALTLNSSIILL